jgi:hypothetical protein
MVRQLGKADDIDRSYYDKQVDKAVEEISKYGDFEWFISSDPVDDDTPPWDAPEEPWGAHIMHNQTN